MRAYLSILALAFATPAVAALGDDISAAYSGICTMPQTCSDTAGCAATPVVGNMRITVTADETRLGRDEGDLSTIDHYPALVDALPLPAVDGHRRSFLVDLAPEGAFRRFALHVQRSDPATGQPMLRPNYFVLVCEAAPA